MRDQFAELTEGMEALAEARQGKGTLQSHAVEAGTSTKKSEDVKVFISHRDSKCDECGEALGMHLTPRHDTSHESCVGARVMPRR